MTEESSSAAPKVTSVNLSSKDVHRLEGKKNVTMLKYTFDRSVGTMAHADKLTAYQHLCLLFDAKVTELMAAGKTPVSEVIVEDIMNERKDIRYFQRLYPSTFAFCTQVCSTQEEANTLSKIRNGHLMMLDTRNTIDNNEGNQKKQTKVAKAAMKTILEMNLRPMTDLDRAREASGEATMVDLKKAMTTGASHKTKGKGAKAAAEKGARHAGAGGATAVGGEPEPEFKPIPVEDLAKTVRQGLFVA